ncbi:MAG: TonB family protein [Azonexus sp.]|jgi:protein TonB|nr:TonB family protein [Azonexus sp.]
MSAQCPLRITSALPEWRRSGPFLLIAAALHLAALAAPHQRAAAALPPPLQVHLVKVHEPQPVAEAPPAIPPLIPPPPEPARPPAKQKTRPILAMAPEQQATTPYTPTIAADTPLSPCRNRAGEEGGGDSDCSPPPPRPSPAKGEGLAATVAPSYAAAYLNNPEPPYPALSRRLGEEGAVRLRVLVTTDGRAATVELAQSSNFPRLDEAARQAVAHWRFVPARRGGEAVEATVIVPIVFRLDS